MKLRELADIVKKYQKNVCVGFILHEHLTMRKLCSKWVVPPRLLTVDQKQKNVFDDSEQCLVVAAMFKRK